MHVLTVKGPVYIYIRYLDLITGGLFITMLTHQKTTDFCSYKQRLYLLMLLFLIVCLNLYDIIHSLQLIKDGLAVEGNPLMRYLLETNPTGAIILKMAVAVLFAAMVGIYARINFQRALGAAILVAALYILVAAWHLTGIYITNWYIAWFP